MQQTAGERVLVVDDQIEVIPEEPSLLAGLHWLFDERSAASVSPTLVTRLDGASPRLPDLSEQCRAPALERVAFLAERSALLAALLRGESELGRALRTVTNGRSHWRHRVRLAHAAGEARRDGSPYAAAVDSSLPVSIVILVHDNLDLTRTCLESLQAHTPAPYELVLVDNGSRDGTGELLELLRTRLGPATPLQVLTNGQNEGFPVGANQGIRAARGRHVVVLNNDTAVMAGWLPALLAAADAEPNLGVITAKILNLDLSVQSAGGILHAPDGSFVIPGQGLGRGDPAVSSRRAVLNAGGPCMLLTRALLERLAPNGRVFDEAYSPGYFEDSDLCLRARNAGFSLLYEPAAEVVHHGKATSCLIDERGELAIWDRFEANKRRFLRRWAVQLARDEAGEAAVSAQAVQP